MLRCDVWRTWQPLANAFTCILLRGTLQSHLFMALLRTQSICGLTCYDCNSPYWTRAQIVFPVVASGAFETPRAEVYTGVTGPGKKKGGKGSWGDTWHWEETLDSQLLGAELPTFNPHRSAPYLKAVIPLGSRKIEMGWVFQTNKATSEGAAGRLGPGQQCLRKRINDVF